MRTSLQFAVRARFLRYTANTVVLEELLGCLYAECCTRNKAIEPGDATTWKVRYPARSGSPQRPFRLDGQQEGPAKSSSAAQHLAQRTCPHSSLFGQVLAKTRRKKGEKVARFQFGPPKTDRSRRTIDFPRFVADLLSSEIQDVKEMRQFAGESWQENGLLFPSQVGTPLEERNVLRRFQTICEANSLPKLRLYDLRHTHASLLIEGVHPKKISERLGHSSIKLTMDTYGHLFEGSDRDSAEKMEKLLGGEPKAASVLTMPDPNRVADKTADKNSKARLVRARK